MAAPLLQCPFCARRYDASITRVAFDSGLGKMWERDQWINGICAADCFPITTHQFVMAVYNERVDTIVRAVGCSRDMAMTAMAGHASNAPVIQILRAVLAGVPHVMRKQQCQRTEAEAVLWHDFVGMVKGGGAT